MRLIVCSIEDKEAKVVANTEKQGSSVSKTASVTLNVKNAFSRGTQDLHLFVEAIVVNVYTEDIPDCPTGLVLTDNRLQGAFQ